MDFNFSGSAMPTKQLRAISEMQIQGAISVKEKATLKQQLLQCDPTFRKKFDEALNAGDMNSIKWLIDSSSKMRTVNKNLAMDLCGPYDLFSFVDDFDNELCSGVPANDMAPDPEFSMGMFIPNNCMNPNSCKSNIDSKSQTVQQHPRPKINKPSRVVPKTKSKLLINSQTVVQTPGTFSLEGQSDWNNESRKRQGSKSLPTQGMQKLFGLSGSAHDEHASNVETSRPVSAFYDQPESFSGITTLTPKIKTEHLETVEKINDMSSQSNTEPTVASILQENGAQTKKEICDSEMGPCDGRNSLTGPPIKDDGRLELAKTRKNERERKRRLAVNRGFGDLYELLKEMEGIEQRRGICTSTSMLGAPKLNKISILKSTIDKIQNFESRIKNLRKENARLQSFLVSWRD